MSKFIIFLVMSILFTIPAYAHNNSEYEFYGFSENQKYCIFEIYGEYETESTSYSEIHIVEVDTNKDVVNPINMEKKDNSNEHITIFEIRKENIGNVIPYLKKYDFGSFYKGTLLFTNPRYGDYIHPKTKPDYESPTFVMGNEIYTIKLSQRKRDQKNTDYYAQKEFDIDVITKNKTITLTKHKTLMVTQHKTIPAAFNYRIVSAYYCYGKIAVIIEYDTVDFEGESRRQAIVTGVIKTENLDMQYD